MPDWTGVLRWWSPDPRGIVPLRRLHVSRSLRRVLPRFEIRIDTAFAEVVDRCSNRGEGDWITPAIRDAYVRLHELGRAHSVEAWRDGRLAGGVYGVELGGLFAGESMFHRERDASKVALVALVERLRAAGDEDTRLLDVQWLTPHLESLGAIEIPREEYLQLLERALALEPAF